MKSSTQKAGLTHRQICDLAVNWLKRPASRKGPGCQVAFSESQGGFSGEIPDAIGFRAGVYGEASVVVEVKISRADFLTDAKKPHRITPEKGMGLYRYYMAPEGLIKPQELPSQWGLVEVSKAGFLKPKMGHVFLGYRDVDVWQHSRAIESEWALLVCMLNRVGDPEKLNNMLKEANNQRARLVRQCERLQAEVRRLGDDLFGARCQIAGETCDPIPRRARRKETEGVISSTSPGN